MVALIFELGFRLGGFPAKLGRRVALAFVGPYTPEF